MRIGVSTACFYPQPIEDILPILAELDVHAIEIFFNTESEFTRDFCRQIATQAEAFGMDIVSIHPYTSLMEGMLLFSDYTRRTEDGLLQYQRYLEYAGMLGARYLTFHGERNMGPPDTPAKWERKCRVYERLCAIGQACGVTIAQENVNWCRSREPQYERTLSEAIPALRFTLDIKQANRAGQDWRDFLDAIGDRLVNIHINDFTATESCKLPGEGEMNYVDFYRRLRQLGYDGHTLIEVYRANFQQTEEMSRALQVLTQALEQTQT